MLNTRFKKLTGLHAGHVYQVKAPSNEMDAPMRWSLQCETLADQKLVVDEHELADRSRWEPVN
jgi:hypothetical protein